MNTLSRILHVDDDPDIQVIAKMALEIVGEFEVLQCSNGPDTIQQAPSFLPDLILLDVMMPGMDGIETLARLRELPETQSTPVIFMTAKAQKSVRVELIECGAIEVITKPFDPMLLPDQLRAVWSRANGI